MNRAEVTRGLEPIAAFEPNHVRAIHSKFEEFGTYPALWERSFDELLGCFKTPESSAKAFRILDSDGNGLVDARETLGALTILSRGHLSERMQLLFDVFDLNKEKEMAFDECFLMIRRTMGGLKKMAGIHSPPEKVIHNMAKQVWKQARKHREVRISAADWFAWWSGDATMRNGLKMFVRKSEEQRGLPTPDQFTNIDYTKGVSEDADTQEKNRLRGSVLGAAGTMAFIPSSEWGGSNPSRAGSKTETLKSSRKSAFVANVDQGGNISRPVHDEENHCRADVSGSTSRADSSRVQSRAEGRPDSK